MTRRSANRRRLFTPVVRVLVTWLAVVAFAAGALSSARAAHANPAVAQSAPADGTPTDKSGYPADGKESVESEDDAKATRRSALPRVRPPVTPSAEFLPVDLHPLSRSFEPARAALMPMANGVGVPLRC
jgi:hypothetical protein